MLEPLGRAIIMMGAPLELLCSGKRRSRLEIYVDVLRIIRRGVNKPTRIMFAANLSWRALKEIIADLERHGFIECKNVKDHRRIFITERGKRLLRELEAISAELMMLNAPSVRSK
ncbi:MAG: winged helix-turn-helix domain-containing protein [Candidatus Bathyarchaeia archaeon]